MNKLTWADFKSITTGDGYPLQDPFAGLVVLFNNSLKAYSAAAEGEVYAIVGDLASGFRANFPNGEEIKIKIGSAYPYEGEGAIDVKGRNLVDGLPKNIEVTSEEVREALADSVNQILDAIRTTLEKTPPELAADIIDQGIMLTGGGALLRGLDRLISAETKMPVHVAENPLDCVVDGTGVCLENDMLSLTSTKNYDE